jgi:hypothetical protein
MVKFPMNVKKKAPDELVYARAGYFISEFSENLSGVAV